ncbi:hypothetical protein JZ751_002401 [Albula glossodonta]|uniref:Uncharacterized protein n=1 Tax=Albula glossodonta TaxID=121402 RepID=A0A8T2MNE0_9TELE|nr:hypothetical protein JZ751_002401 [Albula glossodonta]
MSHSHGSDPIESHRERARGLRPGVWPGLSWLSVARGQSLCHKKPELGHTGFPRLSPRSRKFFHPIIVVFALRPLLRGLLKTSWLEGILPQAHFSEALIAAQPPASLAPPQTQGPQQGGWAHVSVSVVVALHETVQLFRSAWIYCSLFLSSPLPCLFSYSIFPTHSISSSLSHSLSLSLPFPPMGWWRRRRKREREGERRGRREREREGGERKRQTEGERRERGERERQTEGEREGGEREERERQTEGEREWTAMSEKEVSRVWLRRNSGEEHFEHDLNSRRRRGRGTAEGGARGGGLHSFLLELNGRLTDLRQEHLSREQTPLNTSGEGCGLCSRENSEPPVNTPRAHCPTPSETLVAFPLRLWSRVARAEARDMPSQARLAHRTAPCYENKATRARELGADEWRSLARFPRSDSRRIVCPCVIRRGTQGGKDEYRERMIKRERESKATEREGGRER